MSPNLKREILDIKTGQNETEVIFKNGSSFITTASSESARGLRSTILIIDEFRLVKKDILDSVLVPTEIVRQAPYLKNKKYEHLVENPREYYLSSAYFKSHWMFNTIRQALKDNYEGKGAVLFSTDYCTTIKHGIKTREQMRKARQMTDEMSWMMEYENLMIGGAENQFYSFELVNSAQKIEKAWYPKTLEEYVMNKKTRFGDIRKQNGEIRVVAMDVALSKSTKTTKNDFSVIKCIRALQTGEKYERLEVYTESFEGIDTTSQAIRIRQIMEDFDADYLCIDARTYGTSIIDELGKIIYDKERDKEYVPIKCFNNTELADRCKNPSAIPCIYGFIATADRNDEMHKAFKSALQDGKYKMLISHITCREEYLNGKKEYDLSSAEDKARYERPYVYSDLTMNEMINLTAEFVQGSKVKLSEPSTGTKDKYITSAMGNLFIQQLERELTAQNNNSYDDFDCIVLW